MYISFSCFCKELFSIALGQAPRDFKKSRMYVDAGSRTYVESLLRVPVALSKELGLVSRQVYEDWTKTTQSHMVCAANPGDDDMDSEASGQEEDAESPDRAVRRRQYAKRGTALGRQPSGDEVMLFPHDNSGLLLKELVYEVDPKWVIHGTPALGAGIYGIMVPWPVFIAQKNGVCNQIL